MSKPFVDVYKIIDCDWFEELGEPSYDEDEYAPIDYDDVCFGAYECGSFFGGELVDLYVEEPTETYYIRSAMEEPIGDYGWHTCWRWYKSIDGMYETIKKAVEEGTKAVREQNTCSMEFSS